MVLGGSGWLRVSDDGSGIEHEIGGEGGRQLGTRYPPIEIRTVTTMTRSFHM